jgi:hypothetical protein
MWLLLPGREGIVLSGPVAAAGSAKPAAAASRSSPVSPGKTGSIILQTGLFSREENTDAMAGRLREAGFTPFITRRIVNGKEYWAVGVSSGENMHDTTLALKDAGFESFPVY